MELAFHGEVGHIAHRNALRESIFFQPLVAEGDGFGVEIISGHSIAVATELNEEATGAAGWLEDRPHFTAGVFFEAGLQKPKFGSDV
jgi:hypothetical protein